MRRNYLKEAARRLRSSRGETITEVLVSIAVSGLAILMLATAISTAVNTNVRSRDAMSGYYAANNAIASESSANGSGSVSLSAKGSGEAVLLSGGGAVSVEYYINEQVDGTPIATYSAV